jgi:crotonobetainyl-CoA:carnitine CoA-transferase CaiB-like acyl-CoA transferase
MLANQGANQLIGGKTPARMGNAHPNIVPYQVFPTRDGHMVLAVGNDGQFARLCDAAGNPAVSRDVRFCTNPARVENRQDLVPLITRWTMQRSTGEWVSLLDQAGVPCSPILDIAQVMSHPHVLARELHVNTGESLFPPMVANPMLMDGHRLVADQPPPGLNAHTADWKTQAP